MHSLPISMGFRFLVGQRVTTMESKMVYDMTEQDITQPDRELRGVIERTHLPISLTIISRRYEQWPGGNQLHYLCNYFTATGYTQSWFSEVELTHYPIKIPKDEQK